MNIDFVALVPWAIFAGISFGLWAVMQMFSGNKSRAAERLEELRDPRLRNREKDDEKGVGKMLQKAAPALSKALQPKSELEESELRIRLANAGFSSPNAATLYLAIKVACTLFGLMLGTGWGMAKYGLNQAGLTSIVLGAGLGFYIPGIILFIIRSNRRSQIFLQMPDALDLLVVCVEAGLGLDAGMRRVTDELGDAAPELCSEFAQANMQLQMGRARREVLHDLGVRTGVDDMRSLAAILIQADRFGSSIAQALRVQSDSMRTKRSQMAEEKAQKTAVQMLFPLVLFIFPGIFVVLVGPAAIMMMKNLLDK